ncbi:hypothetical protein R6V09_12025 [Streptomyces sp. W16]|uniref:TetR/AcrR family transcriptional regulator n=1 Tax=Streptomyces sp. W16 TaxID=3076631 RepID=UPI00295B845B|nr:hypothetical protein [Streptomyces sp. W16]MDV9170857.1 hypothetical protein [Streptomyces sp. W16]
MTTSPGSRPKTRERILDAAMDVFAEKGFNEMPTASRAGCAKSTRTRSSPHSERLTGPDVEVRTGLAGALVGGLPYALRVVGDEKPAAVDHEKIVVRPVLS